VVKHRPPTTPRQAGERKSRSQAKTSHPGAAQPRRQHDTRRDNLNDTSGPAVSGVVGRPGLGELKTPDNLPERIEAFGSQPLNVTVEEPGG
jgi:hypothetical protein